MCKYDPQAIEKLINNARKVSTNNEAIVLSWPDVVTALLDDGKNLYIPGYIPYIGANYFSSKTKGRRILIYALSQNLRPKDKIAIKWATSWRSNQDGSEALDRQNRNYTRDGQIMMYPFDTGHLPVISAILRSVISKSDECTQRSIYDEIAATNLSKYSFRTKSDKTTDNEESLRKCFEWFSICEIEILKPDYIICAGGLVYTIIKNNINMISEWKGKIIKVAFPSLQVINRHFRKGSNQKTILSMIPDIDLKRPVAYDGKTLQDVIERDLFYFEKMHESIEQQIKNS